jgi:hypothetical protein
MKTKKKPRNIKPKISRSIERTKKQEKQGEKFQENRNVKTSKTFFKENQQKQKINERKTR